MLDSKGIFHHYQPLWNIKDSIIYGYEGFIRNNNNINPEKLFQIVREKNMLYEFDTLSIMKAIEGFPLLSDHLLFVNVFPSTIICKGFQNFLYSVLKHNPFARGNIVFELNETFTEKEIWNTELFKERIQWLKSLGIYLALDDIGKGAASLKKVLEYKPDYIKLDRNYSESLNQSVVKQHMISLILEYCKELNIKVILEGIETSEDLAVAKSINVSIGQGYILGKPKSLNENLRK